MTTTLKTIGTILLVALSLAACSPPARQDARTAEAAPKPAGAATRAPSGRYTADMAHTSVNFRVDHIGLSHFTARFTRAEAELLFDPANPSACSVRAVIDAASLQTNYPEPAKLDFDAQVEHEFLDAARYPKITFASTRVERTGTNTARVTGDLTLHGVTRPVTLAVTFNGGYPAGAMDPENSRIGFSARGSLKRSDFGVTYGLPPAGTNMGVGDEVEVVIEAEFIQPGPARPAS